MAFVGMTGRCLLRRSRVVGVLEVSDSDIAIFVRVPHLHFFVDGGHLERCVERKNWSKAGERNHDFGGCGKKTDEPQTYILGSLIASNMASGIAILSIMVAVARGYISNRMPFHWAVAHRGFGWSTTQSQVGGFSKFHARYSEFVDT
jgi:hypothetical protein